MRSFGCFSLFLLSITAVGQIPPSRCDAINGPFTACTFLTLADNSTGKSGPAPAGTIPYSALPAGNAGKAPVDASAKTASDYVPVEGAPEKHFRWGRALLESFTFLAIEQSYVVPEDYRWVVSENGVPFNHYWRDYKQSLSSQFSSGWNDGDPILFNYVGHPIQGAMTSFIQIQNDPQGEKLEFSNSKPYWWSRFKATLWNAAYSTQWSMGPISEMTVEKYGTKARPPWNRDNTWPCKEKNCYTGVGQVNLVMTPLGGLAWVLAEDLLDKHVVRRVERSTSSRFLVNVTRCGLNPIRSGANILHGKTPWYRASRDPIAFFGSNPLQKVEPPVSRGSGAGQSH
jgi:hypothetical protein